MEKKKSCLLVTGAISVLFLVAVSLIHAGDLNPPAEPAPTMKTLNDVYDKPVWDISDQTFVDWPSNPRFAVAEGVQAGFADDDLVLDKETGLIWARNPTYIQSNPQSWLLAMGFCYTNVALGHRYGWRLPTVEEFSTLIDGGKTQGVYSLVDSPFILVKTDYYWTSSGYTTAALDHAWCVRFVIGPQDIITSDKSLTRYIWPVRGGSGPQVRVGQ